MSKPYVKKLKNLKMGDIELVGGKNASLGEMIGSLTKLNIDFKVMDSTSF